MNNKIPELVDIAHALTGLHEVLKTMLIHRNGLIRLSSENTEYDYLQDYINKMNEICKTLIDEAHEIALTVKSDVNSNESSNTNIDDSEKQEQIDRLQSCNKTQEEMIRYWKDRNLILMGDNLKLEQDIDELQSRYKIQGDRIERLIKQIRVLRRVDYQLHRRAGKLRKIKSIIDED